MAARQIGFAFDNTGLENTRDALVAVLKDPDLFGPGVRVFVSGEAIPHPLPAPPCQPSTMLPAYERVAPWFGLFQFHREHDPEKSWKAPAGAHLGFAVRNDEVDPCNNGVKLTDSQIRQDISSAYRRGFVIIHYGGGHDRFILETVREIKMSRQTMPRARKCHSACPWRSANRIDAHHTFPEELF